MKKIIKYVLVGGVTLLLLLVLLTFSGANWQHIEQLIVSISFKTEFNHNILYSVSLINGSSQQEINQVFKNFDFNKNLSHWDYIGDVKRFCILEDCYVELGHSNSSNFIFENCLFQEINIENSPLFLGFLYQYFSLEKLPGFDLNAWIVLIDDQVVYVQPAEKLTQNEDWQWRIISFPHLSAGSYEFKICAGNSGDRYLASWVRFNQVSTNLVVINPQQSLKFDSAFNHQLIVEYQQDNQVITSNLAKELEISFEQELDDEKILVTILEGEQPIKSSELNLFFQDLVPPSISDISAYYLADNNYLFRLNQPDFLQTEKFDYLFEIRANMEAINETNWEISPEIKSRFFENNHNLLRPVCVNEVCLLKARTTKEIGHFGIRVCNLTGQCSAISKIFPGDY